MTQNGTQVTWNFGFNYKITQFLPKTSASISLNLIFWSCQKFGIDLWRKTQDWDCKIKHGNKMLAKNRAKPVFKVWKSINYWRFNERSKRIFQIFLLLLLELNSAVVWILKCHLRQRLSWRLIGLFTALSMTSPLDSLRRGKEPEFCISSKRIIQCRWIRKS